MKKIAVLLLLLLVMAAAEEVSLKRALELVFVEYDNIGVQPESIPNRLAVTETGSYWIIEFDDVWVPVTSEGEILTEARDEIIDAYKVHYALQTIISQRDKDQYPTTKDTSLTLLLGDIESKETYLVSYQPQLPPELQDDGDDLIAAVGTLKTSVQDSLGAILIIRARESDILYAQAAYSDFEDWRNDFLALLNAFNDVVISGYAYDDTRTNFNLQAQIFLNSSNDTVTKQTVQAFVSGIAISNIPGSLPGLESTVGQWKTNWLDIALTDEKIQGDSEDIYTLYREFYSGESVSGLRDEAYSKVQALATTVPLLVNDLMQCYDDLSPREQGDLDELNRTYNLASKSYIDGAAYESSLDNEKAKNHYTNAIAWAEDSQALATGMANVECEEVKPTPTPGGNVIMDFITSIWGIAFVILVVALVGLYWWNNKKKGDEYENSDYDYY